MKNALSLALSSIVSKPLSSFLCVFSTACAIGLLIILFLLTNGLENGFIKNSKNIDVVVGAKGSPLQFVLSSVYQIDVPNGNIDMNDIQKIIKNPQIKKSVPIAVGDNYKGWRVVGTTADYLGLYDLKISEGQVFQKPFEVLAGAATGLKIGDSFVASHGFSADTDDVHEDSRYKVVGVLEQSGTVADKLLITSIKSVQKAHDHHGHDAHDEHDAHEGHDAHDEHDEKLSQEVTAVFLQVKNPMAVMTLPRDINKNDNILAASPSYEMAKLSKNFGIGENFVFVLSLGLMGIAVLMLFSNLASNLVARQYDLAVLRVLGASPVTIFSTVLFEGIFIGLGGAVAGIFMGHLAAYLIVFQTPVLQAMMLPFDMLKFHMNDLYLIVLGLISGSFAALLPALSASKIDIAALLSKGSS